MLIPKQKTEASRWGLPLEEIEQLGERLRDNYDKFRPYLRTQTHDTSSYGLHYLVSGAKLTKWAHHSLGSIEPYQPLHTDVRVATLEARDAGVGLPDPREGGAYCYTVVFRA